MYKRQVELRPGRDEVVEELDDVVQVPVDEQIARLSLAREQRKRPPDLQKLAVHHTEGNLCSRRDLERLPMDRFTSCIILANEEDSQDLDATDRDSQALATLLLLRDIQTRRLQEAQRRAGGVTARRRASLANVCLLYTSPSPRDGLLSRMPSSA